MLKQIAINLKPSRADPQLPQAGLQDFKEHLAKNPRNPSVANPDFIPFTYRTCPTYKIRSHSPPKKTFSRYLEKNTNTWKIESKCWTIQIYLNKSNESQNQFLRNQLSKQSKWVLQFRDFWEMIAYILVRQCKWYIIVPCHPSGSLSCPELSENQDQLCVRY